MAHRPRSLPTSCAPAIRPSHRLTRLDSHRSFGEVERYNRTLGAEFAYARPWTCETQRADYLHPWLVHYTYHRAHTAIGNQPPASLAPTAVTNVMMQNN